jgi:flagellar biosynthesis protein FlhG
MSSQEKKSFTDIQTLDQFEENLPAYAASLEDGFNGEGDLLHQFKEQEHLLQQTTQMSPQVWAFGGAKGGVGRTLLCATAAFLLAQRGFRVVALDFDLGAANLHTFLGLSQTEKNLEQWLLGQFEHLQEICSPTHIPNLSLITTGSSIFNPSLPSPEQIKRLMLEALELECDYLLIDLGAGIHAHSLDLFNVAGRGFVLTTPEPSSIQNTYGFYKAVLLRRAEIVLKARPWLHKILLRAALSKGKGRITSLGEMLDMLKELDHDVAQEMINCLKALKIPLLINRSGKEDEQQVIKALDRICSRYLHLEIEHTLTVLEDKEIRQFIRQMLPIQDYHVDSYFMRHMNLWLDQVLAQKLYTPAHDDFIDLIASPSFLSLALSSQQHQQSHSLENNQLLFQTMNQMRETIDSIRNEINPMQINPIHIPIPTNQSNIGFNAEFEIRNDLGSYRQTPNPYHNPFNPPPILEMMLSDPPSHDVVAFEEDIRTHYGWFHLKTVDLAPFRPSIRTSILEEGKALSVYEEDYSELLNHSHSMIDISKRVERIHQQNIEALQRGGVQAWRDSKI